MLKHNEERKRKEGYISLPAYTIEIVHTSVTKIFSATSSKTRGTCRTRAARFIRSMTPPVTPLHQKKNKLAKHALINEHFNIKQHLICGQINDEKQQHLDHNIVLIYQMHTK